MTNKVVGVLGGMGPDATVDFMSKVIALTPAGKDQDHLHMLVDHNPTVPNRQAAILGDGDDPGPALAAMAQRLAQAGAEFLVMPCNTAYVFEQSIIDAVDIPLVSIIDVTIGALADDCVAAGLLATDGCIRTGIYQRAMADRGIDAVLPADGEIADIMGLINRVKAGDQSEEVKNSMKAHAEALVARGAAAIIAGCTEIPLVLDAGMLDVPLVSSTDVLAEITVKYALGESPLADTE